MKQYLFLRDCLGLNQPDRLYHASELETLLAIQQHGDLNPSQASRLRELQASGDSGNPTGVESRGSFSGAGLNSGVSNPIDIAKQILQMQQDANKPAIQTLQGQIDPLKQRYSDLLSSIKGQQTTAENTATRAASAGLAARGITADSQMGQEAYSAELQPVTANFQGISAQTGVAEQSDINNIQSAIAQLQAGNPVAAGQTGAGIYAAQQQLAAAQAQASATEQAAKAYSQYHVLTPGQSLYNAQSNSSTPYFPGMPFVPQSNTSTSSSKVNPNSYYG